MSGSPAAITAAITGAGRVLARLCSEQDELAARGGLPAVAEAGYAPGGPSKDAIAAIYAGLREQAPGTKPAA